MDQTLRLIMLLGDLVGTKLAAESYIVPPRKVTSRSRVYRLNKDKENEKARADMDDQQPAAAHAPSRYGRRITAR